MKQMNSRTILVVDDEPQIGQMLAQFLGEHNYEALFFTSGKKALVHLRGEPPSARTAPRQNDSVGLGSDGRTGESNPVALLLTDLVMPEMSGLELARQVKILYPALPIIVMSGSADGYDRDEIFKLGADFIPKPLDFVDLLKRIDSHIAI